MLCGAPSWEPAPDDRLLDLCSHLHKEATSLHFIEDRQDLQLSKFLDLALVAEACGEDAWQRFLKRVASVGAEAIVYYSLHFTSVLYPQSVPAHVLDTLRPEDTDYLELYGSLDGQSARWEQPFLERLFNARSAHRRDRLQRPAPVNAAVASTAPAAVDAPAPVPDGEPGLLVLKVGGSLLSDKRHSGQTDHAAIDAYAAQVAELLATHPGRIVLVTGGGALCHPVGLRIKAAKDDPYAAVALTEPAFRMRWAWTTALRAHGVRAVPLQTTSMLNELPDGTTVTETGVVSRLLAEGALPVLSSDCVVTAALRPCAS